MLLLISDANILIDMEAGQLMERLFQLPMQFAMPDILYWEEIEPGTPDLEVLGLKILEVRGEYVRYASELPDKYGTALSPNDYLALALARKEDVKVMGTVWLLQAMVENRLLSVDEAIAALALMKESRRRLPWADAERILNGLRESCGRRP